MSDATSDSDGMSHEPEAPSVEPNVGHGVPSAPGVPAASAVPSVPAAGPVPWWNAGPQSGTGPTGPEGANPWSVTGSSESTAGPQTTNPWSPAGAVTPPTSDASPTTGAGPAGDPTPPPGSGVGGATGGPWPAGSWGPGPQAGGPWGNAPGGPGSWYGPAGPPPYAPGSGWGPPGGGWGRPAPRSGRGPGKSRRAVAVAAAGVLTAAAVLAGVGIGYSVWRPAPTSTSAAKTTPLTPKTTTTTTTTTTATRGSTRATSTTKTTKATNAKGGPSNIATIATKVDPTLVDIDTVLGDETAEAAGTGMVLTSTGKILTNNHVIEGSTSISVTDLGNGETYQASVIGYDRTQDVAVIQLKNASGLKTANFGDSSSVKVGAAVVGIGNAGGTGGTPSTAGGSVTALSQAITASDSGSGTTEHLTGLIESNCDIRPGDSGGSLVNATGQIVAMDTAASAAQGFSFSGAATGQGYSIPIDSALSIAKAIESGKAASDIHLGATPFLGVEVSPTTSTSPSRTSFGHLGNGFRTPTATPGTFGTGTSTTNKATGTATSTSGSSSTKGVYVEGVLSGTAAATAGIGKGDYITAIGGTTVTTPNALTKAIEQYKPGTKVKVTWAASSGSSQSATVTFSSGPAG